MHQKISKNILKIADTSPFSSKGYGEKGIKLREMSGKGFNVPDGILLSTYYFDHLIDMIQCNDRVNEIVRLENEGYEKLHPLLIKLREHFNLPESIREELFYHAESIQGYIKETTFAVRSAAIGEDGENNSFAGQYASILGVNRENLFTAIIDCYISWWTERAIKYRRTHHIPPSPPNISVIIQRQLVPDFAGVLFTKHPFQGTGHMVIEAVCGLGEKLVSGEVQPAEWIIDPMNGKIISQSADLEKKAILLNQKFIRELVKIGKELEKHFGQGLDIEWAIENNQIYILQLRPITTLDLESVFRDGQTTIEKLTRNIYSRTVVEDLWSDRMTPITSSIMFEKFSDLYTFKNELCKLGLHDIAAQKAIKVINGYGYLNTESIARLMSIIPPLFRFKELMNVFPPDIREVDLNIPFNFKKLFKVILRLPLILSDPAMIPLCTRFFLRRHLSHIDHELKKIKSLNSVTQDILTYKYDLDAILLLLRRLLVRNQWGYGHASVCTWLFCHLAGQIADARPEWILQELTHIPENPTFQIQTHLRTLMTGMPEDIKNALRQSENLNDLWEKLSTDQDTPFVKNIQQFVETYYYRSSNRDFIHSRWKDKPSIVLELLNVIAASNKEFFIKSPKERAFRHFRMLHLAWFPILKILAHSSRNFLALREELRVGLDKVFYVLRHLLLTIERQDAFKKVSHVPDAIFFFELSEIIHVCQGNPLTEELIQTVTNRKAAYENDKNISPPYYIKIKGNVAKDLSKKKKVLSKLFGIPASPGIIKGTARVIYNENEFHKLTSEDILIAYNTDPGWTPLFSTAKGVIVEMGGILNHCAIVAREYGIPAIVGISGATKLFQDGQHLRVNGSTGQIDILEN